MIRPPTLLAAAAVAVALALQISGGFYEEWALALVALATAAAVAGAAWRTYGAPAGNPVVAPALVGAGSAAGLGFHLFTNPTFSADVRAFDGGFRWFALVSLVALSAYLCIHLRASLIRARFLLLLLCFAMMAMVAIRATREPPVGVWNFQHGAAEALLHRLGLGDPRYALLAAMLAGAWLLARAWPGTTGELAGALVLFQPRTLFVLEQGWAEPLIFALFALTADVIARRAHWALIGVALGMLAAGGPSSLFLAIPLAIALPRRRAVWVGEVVLVAVLASFVVAGSVAFPPQLDAGAPSGESLSAAPLAWRFVGSQVHSLALAAPAIGIAILVVCVRRKGDLSVACAAVAAAFAAMLLFRPQSFANDWWLCSCLLAGASAATAVTIPAAQTRPAESLATAGGAG